MKKLKMFVCNLFVMNAFLLQAQSYDTCVSSYHVCFNNPSYSIPASVGAGNYGNQVACLYYTPNPLWLCFQALQPGRLNISMSSVPEHDLDFVCWGPFTADNFNELIASGVCAQLNMDSTGCVSHDASSGPNPMDLGVYPVGNVVDCGFSTSADEFIHIPNMVANEWYLIMVTNYSNQPCTIDIGGDPTSTGTTNCVLNPPLLTANTDSLSGFSYSFDHGPSANQMFIVEGNYLIPSDSTKVNIIAPQNYEVSLSPDFDYSDTIIIDIYHSFMQQYYVSVRLKEGLSVGDYFSELITISGGGSLDSLTINCNGSVIEDNGVEESENSKQSMITPNPVSDVLNCSFGTSINRKFSIVDVSGRTVKSWESNLQKELIDVKFLPNGVYFLKVTEENWNYSRKFIIRKD